MRTQAKRGFTLIELLVVIAIIGLLSTLAVVAMSNARQKARDAKRVSDIKQIQSALDLYATDKNGYPGVEAALELGGTGAVCLDNATGFKGSGCADPTYMGLVPKNPSPNGTAYTYTSHGDAANAIACATGPCVNYKLTFTLEADTGELKAATSGKKPYCTATSGGITCADPPA